METLAEYAGVPVWNGLTDPVPSDSDAGRPVNNRGKNSEELKGLNFVFMGDARNNMGNSLMVACAKMGLNFTACAPKELFPDEELVAKSKSDCRRE